MGPRLGPIALALIKHFESCSLKAYRCSAGVPTIGWGMTFYGPGKPVRMGDTISQAQADIAFMRLIGEFAADVAKLIGDTKTTPAQFGALVSFAYNVGTDIDADTKAEGLGDSTLLKKHLAGDHAGAADEFLKWNKAGGRVVSGLTRRRKAERALYLSDFAELARLTKGEVA